MSLVGNTNYTIRFGFCQNFILGHFPELINLITLCKYCNQISSLLDKLEKRPFLAKNAKKGAKHAQN